MDDREQQRRVKHCLAMIRHAEEVTGNVAMTCRYYGISRQCFYKWKRRSAGRLFGAAPQSHGDRARRGGKIVYLRNHYHFGPLKISMYLQRYHDTTISHSGTWRILKKT